ncbi:putative sulfate/molybdate transporter [Pelomicrobium methylotrophicum]|uniref:Sulfate transporter n=1 Tax=Pelomicrobium methylotrophicum TaxID=2602750 RepID=A0A5C7EVC5_9PROT|nr:putative sulfate/molybdate transporter [Pelomicrobium methylotrophicum]TXF12261.1 sulfate transporter [Pelomicrobium methylotrophicum]
MKPIGKPHSAPAPETARRNRFDRMEWAGALGDLGTLIPFVVAYIGVLKMDPLGILLGFGVAMIVCGTYYRTPFPVQPMKAVGAIATAQAAQTFVVTPAAVHGACLVTGLVWLALGLTGAADRVARLVARPVVVGIVLGLGMSFMLQGAKMMSEGWFLGIVGLTGTGLLLTNRAFPAMFALLLFGFGAGALQNPELLGSVAQARPELRLPSFALSELTLDAFLIGAVFLALPQIPLTLGNAIIAITEENNRLFPDRRISERTVATSTGLINLFGAAIGGVPMCHGAGGMAGHVRFGAQTGGALIILGALLTVLGLFFSSSVEALFRLLPQPILGVILFLAGAQLALGACDFSRDKRERFITVVTAGLAVWNVGLAFVAGMAAHAIHRRGWLRL